MAGSSIDGGAGFSDVGGEAVVRHAVAVAELGVWLAEELQAERDALDAELLARHRELIAAMDTKLKTHLSLPSGSLEHQLVWAEAVMQSSRLRAEKNDSAMAPGLLLAALGGCGSTMSQAWSTREASENREPPKGVAEATGASSSGGVPGMPTEASLAGGARDESVEACPEDKASAPLGSGENGQVAGAKTKDSKAQHSPLDPTLVACHGALHHVERVVKGAVFEGVFGLVILANTVVSIIEVQYLGLVAGGEISYPSFDSTDDPWPNARSAFEVLAWVFGILFFIEFIMKIVGLRISFFHSLWNAFDSFIIILWLLSILFDMDQMINPMILRFCRLVRLVRLFRLLKWVAMFDTLHLLIGSLKASVSVLVWSTILLCTVMMVCSLAFNNLLMPYILDEENELDDNIQLDIYKHWGTFSRCMVTMFEITFANWVPICRLLMEELSEVYAIFFIVYRGIVGFAVLKVISGVFMHETFKVASSDDELMIMQRQRAATEQAAKMQRLFVAADETGNGLLTWDEFHNVLSDPRIHTWLSAMELDVRDVKMIFQLLDGDEEGNGDGQISAVELSEGVSKLRGAAKSMDVVTLMRDCKKLSMEVKGVSEEMKKLRIHLCPGSDEGDELGVAGDIPGACGDRPIPMTL